jgi:hypothetical protein
MTQPLLIAIGIVAMLQALGMVAVSVVSARRGKSIREVKGAIPLVTIGIIVAACLVLYAILR